MLGKVPEWIIKEMIYKILEEDSARVPTAFHGRITSFCSLARNIACGMSISATL